MNVASDIPESTLLRHPDIQCAINGVNGRAYVKGKDLIVKEKANCIINEHLCGSNGDVDFHKDKMQTVYKIATSLGLTSPKESKECFYGVFIPHDVRTQWGEDVLHVYTEKTEALKVMKQSKKARFKQFKSFSDAADFAKNGAEVLPQAQEQTQAGGEKPVSFKGPKPQDLVQFRKAIEAGDLEMVQAAIQENPRYLVSSGDTPSILQEGCRYNALHVAAKSDQLAIAELILTSVESIPLLSRLYDDNDEEGLKARSAVLLDLYLNTPDKSGNETPLHFACKYGALEVVELLTSYRQCQRNTVNKFGATPKEVVCSRATEDKKANKQAILEMLEERYYLPVLRYEDNSMPARLGEAFSPANPLEIPNSPLSPRIEMPAYAGPMSKEQVTEFMKKWQTPPRILRRSELRLTDPEKGHERFARSIAHDFKVPWREYWSFLDTYVDLSSTEGLRMLENYLGRRFEETLLGMFRPVAEENSLKPDSIDKNVLSPISDLCNVFNSITLDEKPETIRETPKFKREHRTRKDHRSFDKHQTKRLNIESYFSGLLCVERSCQVFGKRICNAMLSAATAVDVHLMGTENLRDGLEPEVKHLQALVNGYQQDPRFQSVNVSMVHSRVAAVASSTARPLLTPSEKNMLSTCLRAIAISDGTVSDDEDILFSSRRDDQSSLSVVLKTHLLCLTELLLTELNVMGGSECGSVQTESECETLWAQATPCACDWEPYSHQAKARAAWRRQQKLIPKILNFRHEEEPVVEEVWRSCDGSKEDQDEDDCFETPPSSPLLGARDDLVMEDSFSLPDTFIYPGERPTKTDLAVLDTISECKITPNEYPSIYRWRHLVQLHQDNVVPCGQVAPSPGAWHRRRIAIPSTPRPKELATVTASPRREQWERVTGAYSPSPRRLTPLAFR